MLVNALFSFIGFPSQICDIIYLNFPLFLFISFDLTCFTLDNSVNLNLHVYAQKFWCQKKLLEKLKFNFIKKKKKIENNYSRKNENKTNKRNIEMRETIDNNSEQSDKKLVKISRRIQRISWAEYKRMNIS